MTSLSVILGHLPPTSAYAMLAAAVLSESVLLIGAFVPTFTLLLTAGALARTGRISLVLVIAVAAGAAVTGDFAAHRTGRVFSDRLLDGRLGRRVPGAAWRRVESLMARHGGRAVFLARFLPVIRTLTPHFAGATRLPYRRIAPYSLMAACLWATAEAGAGYAAASSFQELLTLGGPAIASVVLIAVGITALWRRSAKAVRPEATARSRGSAAPSVQATSGQVGAPVAITPRGTRYGTPYRTMARMPRRSDSLDRATPERIAETALLLLDEGGPQALTFRELAARLDIAVASLQRRCTDLAGLLDLCLDHLATRLPAPAPGADWATASEERFTALYRLLAAHPGLVTLRGARPWMGPNLLARLVEPQLADSLRAGMTPGEAIAAYRRMYLLTLGSAGFVDHRDPKSAQAATRRALAGLDPEEFPVLTAHLAEIVPFVTDHEIYFSALRQLIDAAAPAPSPLGVTDQQGPRS
ncbi:VTT domain-containing protein [Streptomyces sp. NPDC008092]|uniref:VTT domain-containing protein n=1 Tax=Streptomyces sp. NPDC008092 TaxID=3364808 RepID=UPI0036EB03F3